MSYPTRVSYAFILLMFVLAVWLHLATPLVTVLFSFFALHMFAIGGRKWVAVTLFLIVLVATGLGFWFFMQQAYVAFPKIASTTIPVVLEWAEKQGIELPFTDYSSLKVVALDTVKEKIANLGKYAQVAVIEVAELIIGIVVAISLFFNSRFDLEYDKGPASNNLYAMSVKEITERFRIFFQSFTTVMGAQIIISGINTALTSIFLVWNQFPFTGVIIVVTFLCGLLPIVGNLISNTLIVGVGFSLSPRMALLALIFLVLLHKLEYFLNYRARWPFMGSKSRSINSFIGSRSLILYFFTV